MKHMRISLLLLACAALSKNASASVCIHTVRKGETLSTILNSLGIGAKTSPYRLYGEDGWIKQNQRANPQVKNWLKLQPDSTLKLLLPQDILDVCRGFEKNPASYENTTAEPMLVPNPSPAPSAPPIPEPSRSPTPALNHPPLVSPPPTHSKTSETFHFFEGALSGSLASPDYILINKIKNFSLAYESIQESTLRLAVDNLLATQDSYNQLAFKASGQRISAGLVFTPVSYLKIIPKIHWWNFQGLLPLAGGDYVDIMSFKLSYFGLGLRSEAQTRTWHNYFGLFWAETSVDGRIGQADQATGITSNAAFGLGYKFSQYISFGLFSSFEDTRLFHGEVATLGTRIKDPKAAPSHSVGEAASTSYQFFSGGGFIQTRF